MVEAGLSFSIGSRQTIPRIRTVTKGAVELYQRDRITEEYHHSKS
jgi:hypothetical protein